MDKGRAVKTSAKEGIDGQREKKHFLKVCFPQKFFWMQEIYLDN